MCKICFIPIVDEELQQPLSGDISNTAYYPMKGIKSGAESIPTEAFFGSDDAANYSIYQTIEHSENELYNDTVPIKHEVRF